MASPPDEKYRRILMSFEPLEPDDLIRVVERVQRAYGYVPRDVAADLAERFGRPAAEIYGMITFYPRLRCTPEEGR